MRESMSMVTAGMVLRAGIVMAVVLLAGQQAQAHTQSLPSCSGLPGGDFFGDDDTAGITVEANGSSATLTGTPTTKPGTGQSGGGNKRYRYAKITVPQLAAGELRVFSTDGAPADAILCSGSSRRAYYKTTYDPEHNREEGAARTARTAADRAAKAAIDARALADRTTNPNPGGAENNARSALRSAASSLDTVARALETAGEGTRGTADTPGTRAANTARAAAQTARNAATHSVTEENDEPTDEITALGTVDKAGDNGRGTGTGAAGDLITAAKALEDAVSDDHAGFMLRAKVNPGEGEYILVTVQSNPATAELNIIPATGPTLAVQFHGALSAGSRKGDIPKGGDVDTRIIRVTAPGLLTLGTTGSTDTKGNLSTVHTADVYVNGGGSGGNFSVAVPVQPNTGGSPPDTPHTLIVAGQTGTTTGTFTLDMDFAVAMRTVAVSLDSATPPNTLAPLVAAPTWATGTEESDDDTTRSSLKNTGGAG